MEMNTTTRPEEVTMPTTHTPITQVPWGSPPLVQPGERCPACGSHILAGGHLVTVVATPADVSDELIHTTDELAREDDQGRIDWEATIDQVDGFYHPDEGCYLFPGQNDDPVFEKIKRGVRALRRDEG